MSHSAPIQLTSRDNFGQPAFGGAVEIIFRHGGAVVTLAVQIAADIAQIFAAQTVASYSGWPWRKTKWLGLLLAVKMSPPFFRRERTL